MNTRNLRFRSNRVRDILALFHEELDGIYGHGEVSAFGEMLFEAFLGWDRVRLLTLREQTIDQSDLLRFHWALEDLKRHRPIQHIIGHVDFCGCRIAVSPDVLIPRPETEEMVSWIVESGKWKVESGKRKVESGKRKVESGERKVESGKRKVESGEWKVESGEWKVESGKRKVERILDLCTGSGCIAIALKKAFPHAEVTAVDVSSAALEMARKNAENNGVEVGFVERDLIGGVNGFNGVDGSYGLIVSNPPYVMEKERAQMQANVLDYDPALALFVPDDDPLRFYRAIATIAKEHLAENGQVVVEINEALGDETCMLLKQYGLCPEVHVDFRGKPRWISATR